MPLDEAVRTLAGEAVRQRREYSQGEERPLGSYLGLLGAYAGGVAAMALVGRRLGRRLPERIPAGDLALVAVATHKLTRVLAKDPITSPLRAPFVRYQGAAGPAELAEEVRGRGPRRAIGELVTCPFCLAQWTATTLTFGLVVAPRATRAAAAVLTAVAASDALQLGYGAAERLSG